jgi:hypothetical protein
MTTPPLTSPVAIPADDHGLAELQFVVPPPSKLGTISRPHLWIVDARLDALSVAHLNPQLLPGGRRPVVTVTSAGHVGINNAGPMANLDVPGSVRVGVIDITGGNDVAERFDAADNLDPGTVVVVDEMGIARVRPCADDYQESVVGVVAGAGGEPGLTLGPPTQAAGALVALTGRVWCKAQASHAAIRPGDLLTTSSSVGHAMRAADRARRLGATLGKALSALESGTGLVLALICLQ